MYSFWPDVLTLKEIGDPADIATYFHLWDDNGCLVAKSIVAQCRQNTNYAIKGISLTVNQGEIVTLIGANGAGKSTTLRTISGLLKPKTGSITFQGEDIAGTPAHKIVGLGSPS